MTRAFRRRGALALPLALGGSPIWIDDELTGDVIHLHVVSADGDRETVRYRLSGKTAEFGLSEIKSAASAIYPALPEPLGLIKRDA